MRTSSQQFHFRPSSRSPIARLLCTSGLVLIASAVAAAQPSAQKKLIEFGWDEPDTAFMRQHLQEMEQTPFDGCVFHVLSANTNGSQGNFTWECWGTRTFAEADLKPALDDLRATPFRRLTNNFLRFNTTPGKLDWFADFSAVLNNARLAARLAREGKCRGLLFDIEQYEGPLFDYRKQKDAKEKTWEQYARQTRQRGRETVRAFQDGFPQLTVLLTFGYCLPWSESNGGKKPLAECHYGLLAPFLDGMIEAAQEGVRLVDGYEMAYGFRDTTRFAQAYQTMKTGLLPIVSNPPKYAEVFSFGFGIWLDRDWRKQGWDEVDLTKNFYSPPALEASVRQALKVADEYVWIYSETPRWWSAEGRPVKLPSAYGEALERARKP
jgi:hypothetical protein